MDEGKTREQLVKEIKVFQERIAELEKSNSELSILCEISDSLSYTLDYQKLVKRIMESLFKIVDFPQPR